ncbi:MAG: hypothetical protein IKB42_04230 [Clostridia bacterium]|nr:hypothetical protein [Clostridia bacterium]
MKTKSTLKHILKLLCCFCLLICSVFMFTACGGDGPGAQPSKPTSGSESGDGGGDDIELDENGNLPEDAGLNTGKFSDYFSGYTVLTNADGSLMLFDPTKNPLLDRMTSFSTLVDRQIDLLAQDILYRLTTIYGAKTGTGNSVGAKNDSVDYVLKTETGVDYVYDSKTAKVSVQSILTSETAPVAHNNHNHTWGANLKVDLTCAHCIQDLINYSGTPNFLYYITSIDFSGAIEGGKSTLVSYASNLSDERVSGKAWAWWNNGLANTTYDSYSAAYKNNLKMVIAEMMSGKETYSTAYNATEYENMTKNIKNLGWLNSYFYDETALANNKLVDYIINNVIGYSLVDFDNKLLEKEYIASKGGVADITFASTAPYENGVFTAQEIANSPRFYKGYSVVIPAIVKQALSNTFAGTTTSIYPKFARVNSTDIDFSIFDAIQDQDVDWNLGPMSVNKIVLKPQEGKKLEGFELKIDTGRVIKEGASASIPLTNIEYYADDVVVELKVNVEYVANGSTLVSTSKTIKCDADTDNDGVIKLDSAGEVYTLPNASNPTERIEYFREFHEVTFDLFPENSDKNAEDQYITENDTTITPFGVYNDGSNGTALSLRDMFTNVFKGDDVLTYDAGNNYVQITFEIVSVKRCTNHSNGQKVDAGIHDENCQYVDFFDYEDIVFDFSISPYDVN